jgi:prepilin signal peptidase PulO-like enzyme (type II secretory pathway)
MSQTSGPMKQSILFPILLPWRMFMHGMRYIFGHPVPFVVVFSLLAALLFYLAALPGPPDENGRVVAGGGNPIPGADTVAAVCAMIVGILVIWVSQHIDHANTVWTKAPSIWRPTGEPIIVDLSDDD